MADQKKRIQQARKKDTWPKLTTNDSGAHIAGGPQEIERLRLFLAAKGVIANVQAEGIRGLNLIVFDDVSPKRLAEIEQLLQEWEMQEISRPSP